MIYCFDIDGTLCTNTEGKYESAEPFPDVIARLNALYDAGNEIKLFTARGSTTGVDWRDLTERQMRDWGVRYHELRFGKPHADVFVDDRAAHFEEWRSVHSRQRATSAVPEGSPPGQGPRGVLASSAYLDVTYSSDRAPTSSYPDLLASWLTRNVYRRPGRMLDLGSGRGDHLRACRRLGYDVTGLDISPRAQEMTPDIPVVVCDLEREGLPLPPGSFDAVFSKSVIEHMREPVRLMSAAYQALRPGGVAVIMTPSWAHTFWGPFYIDHTHVTPFTRPALADAMTLAGFEQVEVRHFYQLPFLWRRPALLPLVRLLAAVPLPYRPYTPAPWGDEVNKLIRFSKEVMLLAIGRKVGA